MASFVPRHRTSAVPLGLLCAAVIVYASLYPFEGWRLPRGSVWLFLEAPWPKYWTGFDLVANLLGYLPLGALACVAVVRGGGRLAWGGAAGVAAGLALSFSCELLQNFLPNRVPSNLDLALNTLGAALGAATAVGILALGGAARWQSWRDRWFVPRSAGGLTLLLLWPLGLLFPLPLPLGVGQVLGRLQDWVGELLADTPATLWWAESFMPLQERPPLLPVTEFLAILLGQLLPCLVMYAVAPPGWRRCVMAVGATALGLAATTLSTALNFGPDHALAWVTPLGLSACGSGLAVALMLSRLSPRASAALGLMVATALVACVNQAPPDAYFAASLQAWEQGRFIHFHGAAQWVGWLWPYAAMMHLWTMAVTRAGR